MDITGSHEELSSYANPDSASAPEEHNESNHEGHALDASYKGNNSNSVDMSGCKRKRDASTDDEIVESISTEKRNSTNDAERTDIGPEDFELQITKAAKSSPEHSSGEPQALGHSSFNPTDKISNRGRDNNQDESDMGYSGAGVQPGTTDPTLTIENDNCETISDQERKCVQYEVTFDLVTNDKSEAACEKLIALKNIFSRQLPKMPKEYIVRLVFDHRHYSLAIKRQGRIIGGVCYRPFYPQRFGEIAFLAINSTEQVKGFGSILMNQLKHVAQRDRIEYFLTYADNFATGYFQKQGFSKAIAMPKDRWVGYIKDYDGGTLMECYIHPSMDYLNIFSVIAKQRAYIQEIIQEFRMRGTVQSGLTSFLQGERLQNLISIPGVVEAGWSAFHLYPGTTERDRNAAQSKLTAFLKSLMEAIRLSSEYKDLNERLVDFEYEPKFEIINSRLNQGDYYRSKESLMMDLVRMMANVEHRFPDNIEVNQASSQFRVSIGKLFEDPTGITVSYKGR